MNSIAFIREAGKMISRLNDVTVLTTVEVKEKIQKDLNFLFSNMQNPSLPSAYRLKKVANDKSFAIDQRVKEKISAFDHI